MNDPYVGQEIVHSLAGTLGLLLTIPATASLFVLREKITREKARGPNEPTRVTAQ